MSVRKTFIVVMSFVVLCLGGCAKEDGHSAIEKALWSCTSEIKSNCSEVFYSYKIKITGKPLHEYDRLPNTSAKTIRNAVFRLCDDGNIRGCSLAAKLSDIDFGNARHKNKRAPDQRAHRDFSYLACRLGNETSCSSMNGLHNSFLRGDKVGGVAKIINSREDLVRLFTKDCSEGLALSCGTLGMMEAHVNYHYIERTVIPPEFEKGTARMQEICEAGQAFICRQLGGAFAKGYEYQAKMPEKTYKLNPEFDRSKALQFYGIGCNAGDLESCEKRYSLALDKTDEETQSFMKRACLLGSKFRVCHTGIK